ncbi:carboxypeptidase-like regulatory domain-containing protein [Flavivirga jejuensis]|uniref:Carboxypeptidase-like regulatory domain-containing protein n=1 Tax=Flavivirga jejuensis TaxID=870487 RepID=A0ABT8WT41_9FLAO|nr:carboxypeptidase-like regulatory domain-containing protein [Flavivirga jejuensis]MDO5976366.1 carboxypeptidase-like regulatory domain-containing protein [Flavivirga jejuensis]
MKKIISSVLLLVISHIIYGQETYKGQIKDSKTKEPLPYVNIGILGGNIGTVSDNDGNFQIELESKFDLDTIQISMIGYKNYIKIVKEFKKEMPRLDSIISLEQEITELEEVVLSNKKLKERTLGNKTKSKSMIGGFSTNQLGNEVGIVIKTKKKPTYINRFNASIASNKYDNVKFRLNFYNLKEGLPYKNILKENIILSTGIKEGVLSADLSKYNIVVEDDFFVSLEWIEDLGKDGLMFSIGLFGSPIIERKTSQGDWNKVGVGIGFTVDVEY